MLKFFPLSSSRHPSQDPPGPPNCPTSSAPACSPVHERDNIYSEHKDLGSILYIPHLLIFALEADLAVSSSALLPEYRQVVLPMTLGGCGFLIFDLEALGHNSRNLLAKCSSAQDYCFFCLLVFSSPTLEKNRRPQITLMSGRVAEGEGWMQSPYSAGQHLVLWHPWQIRRLSCPLLLQSVRKVSKCFHVSTNSAATSNIFV